MLYVRGMVYIEALMPEEAGLMYIQIMMDCLLLLIVIQWYMLEEMLIGHHPLFLGFIEVQTGLHGVELMEDCLIKGLIILK